jgi:hypothetical protein
MMYQKCSAKTGTRRLCPGGEAEESELANGATVNATLSGHHVFPSFSAVQSALVQWDLTAHPVCIVRRNVHFSLYLQYCIHFFLILMLREIIHKTYFGPQLKGTYRGDNRGGILKMFCIYFINLDCTFKPE